MAKQPMTVKVPKVVWLLGDAEQVTKQTGDTQVVTRVRPLYYRPPGSDDPVRIGTIDPDYAEPLMARLGRHERGRRK